MKLTPYTKLIELSKSYNLGFELQFVQGDALMMSTHHHPWSMRESEADIVHDLIVENNLRYGYEIATAFGISTCVIGESIRKTGGKLVSIDAYVEEQYNWSSSYNINTRFIGTEDADGYKLAKNLLTSLQLDDVVKLEIGWSPDDNSKFISKHFTDKLDFVLIDGGHSMDQIDADVKCIIEFLKEDSIIIFHDYPCMGPETVKFIEEKGFTQAQIYKTGFNLAVHGRGKTWNFNQQKWQ